MDTPCMSEQTEVQNGEAYFETQETLLDLELEERIRRSEKEGGNEDAHRFLRKFVHENIHEDF